MTLINSDSDSKLSRRQSDDVVHEWRESARYWQKHAATIRMMFAPITQALIEGASLTEGYTVLDIAGGAGEPSLTIAAVVGPSGSVTCTDIAPEMIAAAESEARGRGITNVNFQQCAADALPFEDKSFAAVVCRLGAMFFPDSLAALREMLRVTRQGGAIALAVWSKSEFNPFAYLVTDVVARHIASQPTDASAPGAFRYAERGSLAKILIEAGAKDVRERVLKFHIAAPISPTEFWQMRSETSGTLREKLAKLSQEQADQIAREVQEAVREFFPDDQMNFPAEMIIVTGTA